MSLLKIRQIEEEISKDHTLRYFSIINKPVVKKCERLKIAANSLIFLSMSDGSISSRFKLVPALTNKVHSRSDTMPVLGLGCKVLTTFVLISWSLNLQEWSPITLVERPLAEGACWAQSFNYPHRGIRYEWSHLENFQTRSATSWMTSSDPSQFYMEYRNLLSPKSKSKKLWNIITFWIVS